MPRHPTSPQRVDAVHSQRAAAEQSRQRSCSAHCSQPNLPAAEGALHYGFRLFMSTKANRLLLLVLLTSWPLTRSGGALFDLPGVPPTAITTTITVLGSTPVLQEY